MSSALSRRPTMVVMKVFEHDGKRYPVIELKDPQNPTKFGFTFGVSKAKLIIENFNDIVKFYRSCGGQ